MQEEEINTVDEVKLSNFSMVLAMIFVIIVMTFLGIKILFF